MTENNNNNGPHILSVEDLQKTVKGLYSELRIYYGAQISVAADMTEAQEILRETGFDLILLDLRFPINGIMVDDAGLQLMLSLRRGNLSNLNQQTPYLMLTAQDFSIPQLSERLDDEERGLVQGGRVGITNKLSAIRSISDLVGKALRLPRRDLVHETPTGSGR